MDMIMEIVNKIIDALKGIIAKLGLGSLVEKITDALAGFEF